MTPKDFIDGYISEKRRRLQDQPAAVVLDILKSSINIIGWLVFLWFIKTTGSILIEYKPTKEVQAKQTMVLEKLCDVQAQHTTDIRVLQEKTDNLKERMGIIEKKLK